MRTRSLVLLLAAAATLSACQDVVGTRDDLSDLEIDELADVLITTSFDVTGDVAAADASVTSDAGAGLALPADPITSHTEFTHTRSCVLGGQRVLEGTRDREWDRATRTGFSDLSLTKTHQACSRPTRSRDISITLDGAPNIAVEAHHQWADGRRSGLQTLSMEGAVDWATSDDRSGTCTIDVDVTFDPETSTRTAVGTVCSRSFERTTTWSHGGHGGTGNS